MGTNRLTGAMGGPSFGAFRIAAAVATVAVAGLVAAGSVAAGAKELQVNTSVAASQAARAPTASAKPVGGLRNLILAQNVFTSWQGAVLGIDQAGTLWAYPGGPGGRLGTPRAIGTGFAGTRLYPIKEGVHGHNHNPTTERLLGVNCAGQMHRYWLEYGWDSDDLFEQGKQVGQGWQGFSFVPVGDLTGDRRPDLLAVKEATGELFLYHYRADAFSGKAIKVGNGWSGYKLLPGADLTGDLRLDILGVAPDGRLYLYPGQGNGFFNKKRQAGQGWLGYDLLSGADVDGDGRPDIMGRDASGRLYFYQGRGDGTFGKKRLVGQGWGPLDAGPDCTANPPKTGKMLRIPWQRPEADWRPFPG